MNTGKPGSRGGGAPGVDNQHEGKGSGSGGTGSGDVKADDANLQDAAQAADLALKRLSKDLEEGNIDEDLLKELGWTEDQLKNFSHRMNQQLKALEQETDAEDKARALQRRRVEELLRSLDLKSKSGARIGDERRDRQQRDTSFRKSEPPAKYRDWMKSYQKSLSGRK